MQHSAWKHEGIKSRARVVINLVFNFLRTSPKLHPDRENIYREN